MRSNERVFRWPLLTILGVFSASPLVAQNTTNAHAEYLPANGSSYRHFLNGPGGATTARWYVSTLKGGRSYCVDLAIDSTFSATANGAANANFFASDGTTAFSPAWVSTSVASPQTGMLATGPLVNVSGAQRFCNTMTAADNTDVVVFIRVDPFFIAAGDTFDFRISIQETTLYAPWFFTDANYEAFTQVQNTTSVALAFTIRHYAYVAVSGGATSPVGSAVTFTLPPFGSTFIAAKATAGVTGAGGIKITYSGPPGAIKANVTSINATGVGLTHSFNILFQTPYPTAGLYNQ